MRFNVLPSMTFVRRSLCGLAIVFLTVATAATASAQAPSHLDGPNLGTWPVGIVETSLRASGGGGAGTYVWQLAGGALPTGISLITQATDFPSSFPTTASAGLIGVATVPGNYSFTLNL